jgi:hypothetical protein
MPGVDRRRSLGIFSLCVGALLFLGMAVGLGRAVRGEDVSAFFVLPFLLTGALVCLGVGFHQLWGHRPRPENPEDPPPAPSSNGGPPPA